MTSTIDVSRDDQNIMVTDTVFKLGDIDGKTFTERVELIYEKVLYWKKNLFLSPTGKSCKLYIDESVKLLNSRVKGTALHNIAFKAIMIMPNLLFQEPLKNSKVKDNLTALERRMHSWLKGNLMELLHKGESIQRNFFIFFKLGVTPCKAEQPLQGMELQEKEAQKDYSMQEMWLERTYC